MLEHAERRTRDFQQRLEREGIELAILSDQGSIAYLGGFWGYLSVEFGRPTFLVLRAGRAPVVLTPLMESEMVGSMTWVDDVRTWEDAGASRWEHVLADIVGLDEKVGGSYRPAGNLMAISPLDKVRAHCFRVGNQPYHQAGDRA